MNDIVSIGDIKISEINVLDNGESLVDLAKEFPLLQFDFARKNVQKNSPSISFGRKKLGEMLTHAQKDLPKGYRFLIKECFRPLSIQRGFWENYKGYLISKYPHLNEEQLYVEISKYIAPVTVAPHCTGGAVDLTLIDDDGNWLQMGCEFNAEPTSCDYKTYFDSTLISNEARNNREMLGHALKKVGFVNYPTEWWHWSYGDKYWAFQAGSDVAIYSMIDWDV